MLPVALLALAVATAVATVTMKLSVVVAPPTAAVVSKTPNEIVLNVTAGEILRLSGDVLINISNDLNTVLYIGPVYAPELPSDLVVAPGRACIPMLVIFNATTTSGGGGLIASIVSEETVTLVNIAEFLVSQIAAPVVVLQSSTAAQLVPLYYMEETREGWVLAYSHDDAWYQACLDVAVRALQAAGYTYNATEVALMARNITMATALTAAPIVLTAGEFEAAVLGGAPLLNFTIGGVPVYVGIALSQSDTVTIRTR